MLVSVSLPEPPVACAVPHRQTDGDAGGAGQAVGVGDGIDAAAAVEDVVAGAGVEDVVERVAGQVGDTVERMRPFSTLAVRVYADRSL
jgi:hypothetical protein